MKTFQVILRILIGAFFIFSALAKFPVIEAFEVYLYRTTFPGFDLAAVAARLVISAELLMGVSFISGLAFRAIWRFAFIIMVLLTGFLTWQYFSGDEGNCFCLGELAELSPGWSLLKNLLLIALLLLVRTSKALRFRKPGVVIAVLAILIFVLPVILSPPDFIIQGSYDAATHDQLALDEALSDNQIPATFVDDRKLMAFYSMGCKFCQMSATRIGEMTERNNIDRELINVVFWGDSTLNATSFFEETHSPPFSYTTLSTKPYLKITKGQMPLILLIKDGDVVHKMNYRTLEESRIINFLKPKP